MIEASLQEVGAGRSIVIDEHATILAGNATVQAATKLGLRKLRVIDAAPDEVVAVRRTGLTEEQKTKLALYDNRAAELAEWDPAVLASLGERLPGFELAAFWESAELRELLAQLDGTSDGRTDPDDVPAPRRTSIKVGDLFALGEHRLLCGDSTNAEHVTRLMDGRRAALFATDPPYLVDYDGTNHPSKKHGGYAKKNKDWSATYREQGWDNSAQGPEFYKAFVQVAIDVAIEPSAAWYCWHASRRQGMLEQVWDAAGAFVHQQIIWAKSRPVLTRSVFLWAHEPCFFGWLKGKKPFVRKGMEEGHPTTVWAISSKEIESKDHPTSKPVRCFLLPMQLHTEKRDVCYEPFSGSGSQIIAAEQAGRRCFASELEPVYVQVAIDRWEAFTGQKAKKLGEVAARRRTRPHGREKTP